MSSLARSMAILTLPAAALGVMAGLAARALETPEPEAPAAPAPLPAQRPPRVRRSGDGAESSPGRAGTSRRVVGNEAEGVVPLDPSYAARLSDPDEDVRHACALELLRMGGSRAAAADLLSPASPEGVKLRDGIVNALSVLSRIENGGTWDLMPEESRLDVQLKYYGTVVPETVLRDERKRYWTLRVAGDPARVQGGGIEKGEAAWAVLELARVRRELGELGDDQWTKLRAEKIGAMRAWVGSLAGRNDIGRDRVRAAEAALERIER